MAKWDNQDQALIFFRKLLAKEDVSIGEIVDNILDFKKQKYDVTAIQDSHGNNIIHVAIMYEATDLVDFLIDLEPKLCMVEAKDGRTPLANAKVLENVVMQKIIEKAIKKEVKRLKMLSAEQLVKILSPSTFGLAFLGIIHNAHMFDGDLLFSLILITIATSLMSSLYFAGKALRDNNKKAGYFSSIANSNKISADTTGQSYLNVPGIDRILAQGLIDKRQEYES